MVTALKEVMTVGNESMLGFDYSQLDICTLIRERDLHGRQLDGRAMVGVLSPLPRPLLQKVS